MAYTPGLQVKAKTRYRIARTLPIAGDVLVKAGDRVAADQIVAQTHQPGEIFPFNLANLLGIAPGDLPGAMKFRPGEQVHRGDLLAVSNGVFGYFRKQYEAPADGTLESASSVTGQVILRGPAIPVVVDAFVAGEVVEVLPGSGAVIETQAAFLQGIFGIGGEQQGTLRTVVDSPEVDLSEELITPELKGCVVVAGRRIHGAAVQRAREVGVKAIVSGGIDDQDLKEVLGYDLGVAITGSEEIGLTIMITEGFGQIAMANRTFSLLQSLQGKLASVNGATQIRAGVLRPEIVVPIEGPVDAEGTAARVGGGILEVGAKVRLIRDPWFGVLGTVSALPVEPRKLGSGSKARILEVISDIGQEKILVPRANVEIVTE